MRFIGADLIVNFIFAITRLQAISSKLTVSTHRLVITSVSFFSNLYCDFYRNIQIVTSLKMVTIWSENSMGEKAGYTDSKNLLSCHCWFTRDQLDICLQILPLWNPRASLNPSCQFQAAWLQFASGAVMPWPSWSSVILMIHILWILCLWKAIPV